MEQDRRTFDWSTFPEDSFEILKSDVELARRQGVLDSLDDADYGDFRYGSIPANIQVHCQHDMPDGKEGDTISLSVGPYGDESAAVDEDTYMGGWPMELIDLPIDDLLSMPYPVFQEKAEAAFQRALDSLSPEAVEALSQASEGEEVWNTPLAPGEMLWTDLSYTDLAGKKKTMHFDSFPDPWQIPLQDVDYMLPVHVYTAGRQMHHPLSLLHGREDLCHHMDAICPKTTRLRLAVQNPGKEAGWGYVDIPSAKAYEIQKKLENLPVSSFLDAYKKKPGIRYGFFGSSGKDAVLQVKETEPVTQRNLQAWYTAERYILKAMPAQDIQQEGFKELIYRLRNLSRFFPKLEGMMEQGTAGPEELADLDRAYLDASITMGEKKPLFLPLPRDTREPLIEQAKHAMSKGASREEICKAFRLLHAGNGSPAENRKLYLSVTEEAASRLEAGQKRG